MKFKEIQKLDEYGMPPYNKIEIENLLESGWTPPDLTKPLRPLNLTLAEDRQIYHYMKYSADQMLNELTKEQLEESFVNYRDGLEEMKKTIIGFKIRRKK